MQNPSNDRAEVVLLLLCNIVSYKPHGPQILNSITPHLTKSYFVYNQSQTRLEDGSKALVQVGEDTEGYNLEQLLEVFVEKRGDAKRDPFGWVASILVVHHLRAFQF